MSKTNKKLELNIPAIISLNHIGCNVYYPTQNVRKKFDPMINLKREEQQLTNFQRIRGGSRTEGPKLSKRNMIAFLGHVSHCLHQEHMAQRKQYRE